MATGLVDKIKEVTGWENATLVSRVLMFFGALLFLGIGVSALGVVL